MQERLCMLQERYRIIRCITREPGEDGSPVASDGLEAEDSQVLRSGAGLEGIRLADGEGAELLLDLYKDLVEI